MGLVSALVAVTALVATAAAGDLLMTSATDVRLREEPSTDARVVATLPIGTELSEESMYKPPDGWRRVQTRGLQAGWILERFAVPFDPSRRAAIVESIVVPRLPQTQAARDPDLGTFFTRTQVVALLERTLLLESDREWQARLAWYYVRGLDSAIGVTSPHRWMGPEERSWLAARAAVVRYNEPGGWRVQYEFLRQTHDRYRGTAAAEDIAWFFVENGVGGECEGDVPCYIARTNLILGEYLRWHPAGGHAAVAAARVARALDNLLHFPRALAEFTPATRCAELHASLDPLRAAVAAATAPDKLDALEAIGRLEALCATAKSVGPR